MITDNERAARCAWLKYLDDVLECAPLEISVETLREANVTFSALSEEEWLTHVAWRRKVGSALEETLQRFCSGGDPTCCDEQFWPKGEADEPVSKG